MLPCASKRNAIDDFWKEIKVTQLYFVLLLTITPKTNLKNSEQFLDPSKCMYKLVRHGPFDIQGGGNEYFLMI